MGWIWIGLWARLEDVDLDWIKVGLGFMFYNDTEGDQWCRVVLGGRNLVICLGIIRYCPCHSIRSDSETPYGCKVL